MQKVKCAYSMLVIQAFRCRNKTKLGRALRSLLPMALACLGNRQSARRASIEDWWVIVAALIDIICQPCISLLCTHAPPTSPQITFCLQPSLQAGLILTACEIRDQPCSGWHQERHVRNRQAYRERRLSNHAYRCINGFGTRRDRCRQKLFREEIDV